MNAYISSVFVAVCQTIACHIPTESGDPVIGLAHFLYLGSCQDVYKRQGLYCRGFADFICLFLSHDHLVQMPDIIHVFLDGSVGGEFAAACGVEEGFLCLLYTSKREYLVFPLAFVP